MKKINPTLQVIHDRHSVRTFDDQDIPDENPDHSPIKSQNLKSNIKNKVNFKLTYLRLNQLKISMMHLSKCLILQ